MSSIATPQYKVLVGLLCLGIVAFYAQTIRPGHNWDGDYALYVMQAEILARGDLYEETRYIANPLNPIRPSLYPPGLPLLLAPAYRLVGSDLDRLKWVGILAFGAWLFVFAYIARDFLGERLGLLATLLMGVHPYFWELKDTIFATFPFLALCYGSLLCTDRLLDNDTSVSHKRWLTALLAVLVAFAYLTRTVAVVLFPTVILASWLKAGSVWNRAVAALVAGAVMIGAASVLFPVDTATYVGYFDTISLRGIARTGLDYFFAVGAFLQTEALGRNIVNTALITSMAVLAVIGFIARLRQSISVYEVFAAAYCALLLVYPVRFEPVRYLLPVWPLILIYGLHAAAILAGRYSGTIGRHAPIAVAVSLALSFSFAYAGKDWGPVRNAATGPEAEELYAAIQHLVPEDAVILARKPAIIALFSGRRSAAWPRNFDDDHEMWSYVDSVGARYLLQDRHHFGDGTFDPDDRLDRFVDTNEASLDPVFENEWFRLFSLAPEAPPE